MRAELREDGWHVAEPEAAVGTAQSGGEGSKDKETMRALKATLRDVKDENARLKAVADETEAQRASLGSQIDMLADFLMLNYQGEVGKGGSESAVEIAIRLLKKDQ